jgi:spore maturation protein CgeB
MKFVLFYHSLVSDWNHGNAHFLRGIVTELLLRGHDVNVYEQADSWSSTNLRAEHGEQPILDFQRAYPLLRGSYYEPDDLPLDEMLDGADVVIVHEWNAHELVKRVGVHHCRNRSYNLLFHDTHYRAATDRAGMSAYDLSHYDGVLAYGEVLKNIYLEQGWTSHAWTWHEAADTRVFQPKPHIEKTRDLVWVGNWGDDERTAELHEFLIQPVKAIGLDAEVFGVRYPEEATKSLSEAGIQYGGWLANFRAPDVFAQFRMTVHVPRRPYVEALPGIPTIRPFEALACGIPLISSPWSDVEGLFTPGQDFLVARNGGEMQRHMRALIADKAMAREIADNGLQTILRRHTCRHRVDELLGILASLNAVS